VSLAIKGGVITRQVLKTRNSEPRLKEKGASLHVKFQKRETASLAKRNSEGRHCNRSTKNEIVVHQSAKRELIRKIASHRDSSTE
jgi:hypothetical protein